MERHQAAASERRIQGGGVSATGSSARADHAGSSRGMRTNDQEHDTGECPQGPNPQPQRKQTDRRLPHARPCVIEGC